MNILIVDDSELFRRGMQQLIESYCKSPLLKEAGSVAEGIRLYKEFRADAVLLDLSLPDGSGLDVLKVIRKEGRPVLVMVLTDYSSDQLRIRALQEGADYFLDKATEFEMAGIMLRDREKHL